MNRRTRIRLPVLLLAAAHLPMIAPGWLAPYPFAAQHRDYPYAPPARIHFTDDSGSLRLWPVVYSLIPDLAGGYQEDRSHEYPLSLTQQPGVFLLGTDGFGRDVLSRLLYGGQISLLTGLLAAFLSLALGAGAGVASGYFGGWPDRLLMRGGEVVMALPWLYLLLGVRALLPLHISTVEAFVLLIAIIGGVGWVRPARLIRAVALSGRERGFVQAARGFGASHRYVIRRHILPFTAGVILTQATVLIPQYVLAEVTLSFLGLGIGEPVPSWGNMLAEARQYHSLVSHPWLLAPGMAMIPVLLGYFLLADALLDRSENSRS